MDFFLFWVLEFRRILLWDGIPWTWLGVFFLRGVKLEWNIFPLEHDLLEIHDGRFSSSLVFACNQVVVRSFDHSVWDIKKFTKSSFGISRTCLVVVDSYVTFFQTKVRYVFWMKTNLFSCLCSKFSTTLFSKSSSKHYEWIVIFQLAFQEVCQVDRASWTGEAINDFWSMSGNFTYRHHFEPRVKLNSPREESFPIPLKYIVVSRTTHTNLDVVQEKRIDEHWNIDGSRDLSDSWTGFTQFTLLSEKPPEGPLWSGLTKRQATSRPDHLWPELWTKLGENAKLKEKQKWSNEKLHLDNARKLRGINFIDPEDKEFKETIQNARKKLETPVATAMPCKISKNNKNCGNGESHKVKSKLACILEASESTRLRMGESLPTHHEDHVAGKGDN